MNQQYRIPTLTSRSDTHSVTVAVGENLVLEALVQCEAMVVATSQADVSQLSAWARLHGTVGYQPTVYPGLALRRSCDRYTDLPLALPRLVSYRGLGQRVFRPCRPRVRSAISVLHQVYRLWRTATPGGSTPTAVHPGVAEPSADPLLISPPIPTWRPCNSYLSTCSLPAWLT
jgi:hypothetical protein